MTQLLIDLARRRPALAVRVVPALVLGVVLGYGGVLWMNVLHQAEGAHETNEPPLLVHWLRDATLALPLVVAAVWIGLLVCRRLLERAGARPGPVAGTVLVAVSSAASVSLVLGLATPLHGAAFGHTHAAADLPWALHMGRDGLAAFSAELVLAAVTAAALARRGPWLAPAVERWALPARRVPRAVVQGAVFAVLVAPAGVLAATGAELAVADLSPGAPCPAGAPLKVFDVRTIDVDIPLNRFGDHDPLGKMYVAVVHDDAKPGKLDAQVALIRAEERTRRVSIGLRNDPIQPMVVRANEGDCVEMRFTNDASGGDYGVHIDGLAFETGSSGDAIGANPKTSVARGASITYRYFVPEGRALEGLHYVRPGPGNRLQVSHGLFGALAVEPPGSVYSRIEDAKPIESGWEANIVPGGGAKAFREYAQLYHEVGEEDFRIPTKGGDVLPRVDKHTESYRPGARAMNYRSEPFLHRLDRAPDQESLGYSSFPFGDPATPMPRGYQGDPTKIRILHSGSEMFHVFHLHGGGIRWRFNPVADHSFDYGDTGLDKHPKAQLSPSTRLDSQAFGPGEAYNLEIEGGAGGVQQGAGEFLFHCHIAEHYISGMWSFWRVYDTRQPDLSTLPDRAAKPEPVPSTALIGKTIAGSTLTAANLDQWIRPQLSPPGVPKSAQDAAVWNWTVQQTAAGPLYLGAPEDKSSWPDLLTTADWDADPTQLRGHPGLYPPDVVPAGQTRPEILFNPDNGRPAFPLLRPQIGKRNPFSPNGHSGAPWLGETGDAPKQADVDPWAGRPDGICPAGAPVRHFNIVAIQLPIRITPNGLTDSNGEIYVLAHDKEDVLAGRKPAQPLAIRADIGDCVAVTLTNEQRDTLEAPFTKVNLHIHHVQFDTQASDGVISGMSFEQSLRPHTIEDPTLTAASAEHATTIALSSTAKFQKGEWIAVGQGTEDIEIRQITAVDATTVTLDRELEHPHPAGQGAGVEFMQSRWYPDVQLDNIFWHDHVDGIHAWGHGLVGQLIVEPAGATFHDPSTGAQVDSGTLVDIHRAAAGSAACDHPSGRPDPCQLAPGSVEGSFRELALWTLDENPITDSTLNLRATPFSERLLANPDPSLVLSSYTHGDPNTPIPRAYPGDPVVIRTINVGPSVDTLHIDGHRLLLENRFLGADGRPAATPADGLTYGISERFTAILQGGAGSAGDYLYMNGINRRFRQGAWGILRVLANKAGDLQALPGRPDPPSGPGLPVRTGGRPPAASGPGTPCPPGAPSHKFAISAVDVPDVFAGHGHRSVFVPTAASAAVRAGRTNPEPLVLHVDAGECMDVTFKNELKNDRSSFHVSELLREVGSSGVNVGFNPEQTVARGGTRAYRFYADSDRIGSALITDLGGPRPGADGLYGAVVVDPAGATVTDPRTAAAVDIGSQVDVHVAGQQPYRDFALLFSDLDAVIGGSFMPYPTQVSDAALINYRSAGARPDNAATFSSTAQADPATPLLRAVAGDRVVVHALAAPGDEQVHVLSLGGQTWTLDPRIDGADEVSAHQLGPWQTVDAEIVGGAGGRAHAIGDWFYGDIRRPFTQTGLWGLMRVYATAPTDLRPLP